MPAFITHSLLGKDVLKKLQPDVRCAIQRHHAAFLWGTLGPDLFFFRILPPRGDHNLPKIGSRIHQDRPDRLFCVMEKALRRHVDQSDFFVLFSYLCGFICHYRLDSTAHPFVYSMQQCHTGLTVDRRKGGAHHRIEADLDTALLQKRTGMPPNVFAIRRQYRMTDAEKMTISGFWQDILAEVYGEQLSQEEMMLSFRDVLWLQSCFMESSGILFYLARFGDSLLATEPASAHFLMPRVSYDVLNERHHIWHRADNGKCSRESFEDLFLSAFRLSVQDITALAKGIRNNIPWNLEIKGSFDEGAPRQKGE